MVEGGGKVVNAVEPCFTKGIETGIGRIKPCGWCKHRLRTGFFHPFLHQFLHFYAVQKVKRKGRKCF